MSELYKTIREESNRRNETNDCFVKALAIAFDISYQQAHEICKFQGREDRRGTRNYAIPSMIKHAQTVTQTQVEEHRPTQVNTRGKMGKISLKTIGKKYPKGRFLILVNTHAAAMVDGEIHDWSEDTRRLVLRMYEVK